MSDISLFVVLLTGICFVVVLVMIVLVDFY